MANYWIDRNAKAQDKLMRQGVAATQSQLKKYYKTAMVRVLGQFEKTYNKLLSNIEEGKAPTPADLYKLDTYWQMQGQLKDELQLLGDREAALLSKQFTQQYIDVYNALAVPTERAFGTISTEMAEQMINQIWCADGKSWSSRIWTNTEKLQEALNEHLLDCVITGKKTTELKNILQQDFNVSYSRADSVVRTEIAHIQTQAAKKRYEDYGIQQVEIWADEDERRCELCGKLHEKKYYIGEAVPIPAHPRCRCCIVPVVEDIKSSVNDMQEEKATNKFGQEVKFDKGLEDEKWKQPVQTIKRLNKEYNSRLTSIEIGAEKLAGSANLGGAIKLSTTKLDIAIHEFAHTINQQNLYKFKVEDTEDFWKEIQSIRRKYKKDVGSDSSRWISSYANENIDEFMAEAFTHAKLKELGLEKPYQYGDDYTYSDEVLKIVNKYFKKKKKKK